MRSRNRTAESTEHKQAVKAIVLALIALVVTAVANQRSEPPRFFRRWVLVAEKSDPYTQGQRRRTNAQCAGNAPIAFAIAPTIVRDLAPIRVSTIAPTSVSGI